MSGKVRFRTVDEARGYALAANRLRNSQGEYQINHYCYTCGHCGTIHLTKRESWKDEPLELVVKAAPRELQEWAMGRRDDELAAG